MVKRKQADSDVSGALTPVSTPGKIREFMCVRCGRRRTGEKSALWTTQVHGQAEVCWGCYEQLQKRRVKASERQSKKQTRDEHKALATEKKIENEGLVVCPVLLDAEETAQQRRAAAADKTGPLLRSSELVELMNEHMTADTTPHYYKRWLECLSSEGFSRQKGSNQFLEHGAKINPALPSLQKLADAAASKMDWFNAARQREVKHIKSVVDRLVARYTRAGEWRATMNGLSSAPQPSAENSELLELLSQCREILTYASCSYTSDVVRAARVVSTLVAEKVADASGSASSSSPNDEDDFQLMRYKLWQLLLASTQACTSEEPITGLTAKHKAEIHELVQSVLALPNASTVLTEGQVDGLQVFVRKNSGK